MYKDKDLKALIFSPTDLTNFMESPFISWMDRFALENPGFLEGIEFHKDSMLELLAAKGISHEDEFLDELQKEYGKENVKVLSSKDREVARRETIQAMSDGYQIIFQAYLERDNFAGYSDFLFKVDGESKFGSYHYEAWDTKLSSKIKPYFLLQLSCYSWMLEEMQGVLPGEIVVVMGNKVKERFRIANFYSYFQLLKEQFIEANRKFKNNLDDQPNPEIFSKLGKWEGYGTDLMIERDSLSFVANMRKSQIRRFHEANIKTLTELAKTVETNIKGIGNLTFEKLRDQASIQLQSKGQDLPAFKVLKEDNRKGLSSLPPRSESDVFFDIEGHPLMDEGLEYLWGVSYYGKGEEEYESGTKYPFKDWWAHTYEQEKVAFEGFVDWSYSRWLADPKMHIYHYASYEVTAMRKLAQKYNTRQEEVANLLKSNVMIDLYSIVKNGLLIGEPRYSIKNVEHLYRSKRETEVATGGDSVVYYESWRAGGGADEWSNNPSGYDLWLSSPEQFNWEEWSELKEIRDYNIDDCESTLELVEWLRKVQSESCIEFEMGQGLIEEIKEKTSQQEAKSALRERQQDLLIKFENSDVLKADNIAKKIADLIGFYHRESNVGIWIYFDRLEKSEEELFDDATAIVGVKLDRVEEADGKINFCGFFDSQQVIRRDKFKAATIAGFEVKLKNITFSDSEEENIGQLGFSIPVTEAVQSFDLPVTILGEEGSVNTQTLEKRICEIAELYFEKQTISPLLKTILGREKPRFTEKDQLPVTRSIYTDDEGYNLAMVNTVRSMDQTCLCIQGPPGSGKTYSAKNIIEALVKSGNRVGVMSNSHVAIMNLLGPICKALPDYQIAKVGPSSISSDQFEEQYSIKEYPNLYFRKDMKFPKTKMPYTDCYVVGATAYGFANQISIDNPVDYLFVDEASQVALANLVAVSSATRNIILMGDQMQLEQPIQGAHPGDAGKSALEFMLGDHAVVPLDQGIFLERTYRMHPDVCRPLSEIVYEGKLVTAKENEKIHLDIPESNLITINTGVLSVTTQHEDNRQSSEEEVVKVQELIDEIVTGQFTDNQGVTKDITKEDILVVAPYNMQVNLLKEKLDDDIQIGTIDKFQGQQAPVVIVSIGASDVNESARGLDFVLDINRLNVAVSRAQALAVIVHNEGLHLCDVQSVAQIEKVNLFCRLIN